MRLSEKAVQPNGVREKVTMDKSGANRSATGKAIENNAVAVEVRQIKYLDNIVEQDHEAVKRNAQPMLGVETFRAATCLLAAVELMHIIRKGQMAMLGCEGMSFADQFYALAAQVRPASGLRHVHRSKTAFSKLMRQNPRDRTSRPIEKMQSHNL